MRWHGAMGLMMVLATGHAAAAQGPVPAPPDASDPPARVGRLSIAEGVVSFRPAAADSWAVATPNRVVTTGDRLWVDSAGRAEVEVGADAIRIARETELDVLHLDDDMLQLRVPQGTASVRLKSIRIGDVYELDGANAAITLLQAGEYRLDVPTSGDTTRLAVWAGRAEVTAAGSTFEVDSGQVATVAGARNPTYNVVTVGSPDDFDRWVVERDQTLDRAPASSRYVSSEIAGADDLDEYGHWVIEPDYGPVWFPNTVAVGWAPYGFGHWVWVDPWGWTWVDNAPWGWAPFHYGRWAYIGGVWGWWPGPILVSSYGYPYYPPYAPCLVTFIGGPGWGLDYFGGAWGVGWFPLAPWDVYVPPYRFGPMYGHRINPVPPRGPAPTPYRNRGVEGAVTAIPQRAFSSGEAVSRAAVRVPGEAMARAPVNDGRAPVIPTTASLVRRGATGPSVASPPARLAGMTGVALHAPPMTIPFSAEQRALSASGGRPLTWTERAQLRTTIPAQPTVAHIRSAALPSSGGTTLQPQRSGLPQARPALPPASARRVSAVQSPLDGAYAAERQQMESRHITQYANPRAGESSQALYNRQEAERRDLQSRYQSARSQGMTRIPPSAAAPRAGAGGGGGHAH